MEERETVAEYLFRINDIVNNMKSLGEDIKDSDVSYEMRIGTLIVQRREAALKAKEVTEESERKSEEDDLEEDEVAYMSKKFKKFRFKKRSQSQNLTCYGCGKLGHYVSSCPTLKGQNQRKKEGGNFKGRFGRKAFISDWDSISEEDKPEESKEDECLFMAILKTPQTATEVEEGREDSDSKIEEILKECERFAVKCNQQKSQLKALSFELQKSKQLLVKLFKLKLSTLCSVSLIFSSLMKSQSYTEWSTKRCREEISLILEERSMKMIEIWKHYTKQIGKTGIGYICDTVTKVKQNDTVFVKAPSGEVYARFPIIKPSRSNYDLLDNTYSNLRLNESDFVTSSFRNFKVTKMYVKKSDLTQVQKVKDNRSLVKSKMMWIPKRMNDVSMLVYTTFKAGNTNDKWYVDSSCSRHMTGDGSKFVSLKNFDEGNVIFGDNQKAKIIGIVTISKPDEFPEIKEVLLVEGLKHNLLSVSQLCDNGKKVCFDKEKCNVVDIELEKVIFSACRSSRNVYTVYEEATYYNLTSLDEAILCINDDSSSIPGSTEASPSHSVQGLNESVKSTSGLDDHREVIYPELQKQVQAKTSLVLLRLKSEDWIVAMKEELDQIHKNDTWTLILKPAAKNVIGSKWIYRNKLDEKGTVIRNKARLVCKGYSQKAGIDYDETFTLVARMESIRMLLSFACHKQVKVYQMDVKSAFLNGELNKEVYLEQPEVFKDPRSIIRSLLCLTASRLDIMYSVGLVARFQSNPRISHLQAAKRILIYVKGTISYCLHYIFSPTLSITAFSDVDWVDPYLTEKVHLDVAIFLVPT
ncbi:uncharacterized protein LOC132277427 [Cornus florida]|uniref:uncharacterized protein LOC132277427 n=1 Tax=Cornus florida TaxID=4283 RepID=UPI00289DF8E9|nr:uncharacterized protein LOC132277427 [Cornus florida]